MRQALRTHLARLRRHAHLPVVVAGAYLLLYVAACLARPLGGHGALALSDFGEVPVAGLAVIVGLQVVARDPRPAARRAWLAIVAAIVFDQLGNVLYGVFDLAGLQPFPSIADVFYLLFYPLMLAGLLRVPAPSGRLDFLDWRIWSNAAIVVLGGGMAILHFVATPALAQLDTDPLVAAISLAYPVGDVALVAALATLMSRRPYTTDRTTIAWFIGGTAAWLVADLLFALVSANGSYGPGSPPDFLWLLGDAGFLLAAQSALAGLAEAEPLRAAEPLRIGRIGAYAMLGIGLATLLLAAFENGIGDIALLASISTILTALVVARQVTNERDRRRSEAARIAEHAAAAASAARLARTDFLTALPNRLHFREALRDALEGARSDQAGVTLLSVDLDFFKSVNDTFGHEAGDRLLEAVGRRLSAGIRAEDTVARLGGDEFAVILPGTTLETGLRVATRLEMMLGRPYEIGGSPVTVTASLGLTAEEHGGLDADVLMHQADVAMYEAKREHAGPTVWTPAFERHSPAITLIGELRTCLDQRGLTLRFQPLRDLASGTIVACEALVRWPHPTLGLLEPDRFLPLARRAGLMSRLDAQVLDTALAELAGWRALGLDIGMNVNVTASSLSQPGVAASVASMLKEHDVPPSALTLELTEEVLFEGDAAPATVQEIRASGVRIALDDFGTGASSLARLRDLEADCLKIDRGFVATALHDSRQRTIVEGMVRLAHGLGLAIVAEGIEDDRTLAFLAETGVDTGQGYYIARPLDAPAFLRFMQIEAQGRADTRTTAGSYRASLGRSAEYSPPAGA